jgi:hypothetical protein
MIIQFLPFLWDVEWAVPAVCRRLRDAVVKDVTYQLTMTLLREMVRHAKVLYHPQRALSGDAYPPLPAHIMAMLEHPHAHRVMRSWWFPSLVATPDSVPNDRVTKFVPPPEVVRQSTSTVEVDGTITTTSTTTTTRTLRPMYFTSLRDWLRGDVAPRGGRVHGWAHGRFGVVLKPFLVRALTLMRERGEPGIDWHAVRAGFQPDMQSNAPVRAWHLVDLSRSSQWWVLCDSMDPDVHMNPRLIRFTRGAPSRRELARRLARVSSKRSGGALWTLSEWQYAHVYFKLCTSWVTGEQALPYLSTLLPCYPPPPTANARSLDFIHHILQPCLVWHRLTHRLREIARVIAGWTSDALFTRSVAECMLPAVATVSESDASLLASHWAYFNGTGCDIPTAWVWLLHVEWIMVRHGVPVPRRVVGPPARPPLPPDGSPAFALVSAARRGPSLLDWGDRAGWFALSGRQLHTLSQPSGPSWLDPIHAQPVDRVPGLSTTKPRTFDLTASTDLMVSTDESSTEDDGDEDP